MAHLEENVKCHVFRFCNFSASINTTKRFKISECIPYLGQPSISYDLSTTSYQQTTKGILKNEGCWFSLSS